MSGNSESELKMHKCTICDFRSKRKYNVQIHKKRWHKSDLINDTNGDQPLPQSHEPQKPLHQLEHQHYNRKHSINGQGPPQHRNGTNVIDAKLIEEHSKLKDDFMSLRNKYESIKSEYLLQKQEYQHQADHTQDQFAYRYPKGYQYQAADVNPVEDQKLY